MDACQAEGLLSVCLHLIKYVGPVASMLNEGLRGSTYSFCEHVQSEVLLPNWPRYFWTFSLYLMHPASTVRQAASIIFKYIVAKASSNSGLLKLVLQALCANWSVNIRKDLMESRYSYQGRKMQQEMVKGNLLQRESFGRQFSLEEETQRSTSALHEIQEDDILDKHFCQAWEWREGRLLAYELIVKFLIINHIHYLFPSYALMPPRFDGSVSADSAATHSQKPALPQRPVLSKSFSHNSSSLCQGYTAQFQSLKRSESGQRKKLLEDKRSSTLMEGTFIKKQFSKHYSYFSDQSGLSHDQKGSVNAATSLLCKTRDMDAALKVNEEHIQEQEMLIPFPVELQSSEQRSTLPQDVMMLLHAAQSISRVLARQDESDIDWLQNVQLQALSTILRQMLLQTIKCLADGRWEVRRMAQQTLPLITECARWYDMAILTSLWNDYLHPEESLMSYGLALALASSVQHATRLIHLTEAPPMSWKDPDTYHGITLPIIAAVTGGLQKWCGVALSLLGRTAVDKLTVVTLEIIMTTQICFSDTLSESFQCEVAVLTKILHVFCHAHPQHPLSQQCSSEGNLREFESPIDGYLCSCLHVAECMESLASQVERYLLTELHQFIPPFLQICSVQGVCTLFQVLLHLVGHFSQDSHVATSLLDGCVIVGNKIAKWMQQFTSHDEKPLMHVVNAAVEEITALVTDQNTEMSTLKLLFDVFLSISDFVEAEKLTLMLSALSSRLKGMGTVNLDNNTYKSSEDMDTKILIYLSNNIAAIQADNGDSSDEDAEENHGENQAAESLSLSVSGGSGQMPWPAHVGTEEHEIYAERNNQDGSGSDWDWDDEQEDQASLYSVVSQFFQQLQESHKGGMYMLPFSARK
ncbi:uncharacterized protein LOC110989242 [Acanthaster planci]|uniref:Uncharacterized protein LOC110989242 n=1 Tax=Acanthaster planci TaxID=133434 RepID=A0A8B7ZUD5_ACAPL|nr:uncharacterized protein LOC110989242 [Acanthaster planci]